ncbi:28S ribosomal protein S15, mitochondrial [Rhipicephalus microplus]|uniref:28S ribosomal protein S15, mitochondrial n=1 Tax=Rhipicephalus microplus TaxID=6941 RepID=UPI003F6B0937
MAGLARLSCSVTTLFSKISITRAATAATEASLLRCRSATRVCRRFRNRKVLSWPTDYLPFEWSYPAPPDVIAKCGDGDLEPTDPTLPLNGFELSDELRAASPEVKKVFSLQLASLRQIHEAKKQRFVKLCQRHPYDFDSLEYKVAYKTFLVRKLKELYNMQPKRRDLKDALAKAIEGRNKAFKYLYRYDRERFRSVACTLHVTYTPAQLHYITQSVTKKGELRRLTAEYCTRIKQDKMNAFHEKLKAQQATFLEEKRSTEEWISAETERLGLSENDLKSTEYTGIFRQPTHCS